MGSTVAPRRGRSQDGHIETLERQLDLVQSKVIGLKHLSELFSLRFFCAEHLMLQPVASFCCGPCDVKAKHPLTWLHEGHFCAWKGLTSPDLCKPPLEGEKRKTRHRRGKGLNPSDD